MRPVTAAVTFDYGQRYKTGKLHRGVDFGCAYGTSVKAMRPGKVSHVGLGGWGPSYGLQVIIKTSDGRYELYAHLSQTLVKVGATIAAGQVIAKSGGTPKYTGDKRAGNSTGNHLHVQLNVSNYYTSNINPWPSINWQPVKPKPVKPVSKGAWFTIGSYNLKSPTLTRTGIHAWTSRRDRQIANIKAANVDVLCLQETGGKSDVAWYDAELAKIGLTRVVGERWRYIYIRKATVEFLVGGVVDLVPEYQGDDKPMPWALLDANGSNTLVGDWHLEEANGTVPDDIRPDQAGNGVAQLDTIARRKDVLAYTGAPIGRDRYAIAGDTNSESRVADEMRTHGFLSALTNALKSNGGYIATFNNWLASRNGKQIDAIFIDKTRPVESWAQKADSVASDHNFIYATLGRKA